MRADIFCRVVDNYGDIGVCWRLARRLAQGRGWQVRLWVDDLSAFARIEPDARPELPAQTVQAVAVRHWQEPLTQADPGDVVIEAFACDPPAEFINAMRATHPVWINLEYLSAEAWVESCHGLPSLQPNGLVKHFFFPGFTAATGGLIREPGLSAARDAWQADAAAQEDFLRRLGVSGEMLARRRAGARLVTLFCYPQAPVADMAGALAALPEGAILLVPEGVAPALDSLTLAGLDVVRVPFVAQPDFDRLLWLADLNLVRGEDSFVRAAWAGRPFLWHIYPQDDAVHLTKLDAWLARYDLPAPARALMQAWNAVPARGLPALAGAALAGTPWQDWQKAARAWDAAQAAPPDLGDVLADFCTDLSKTR
ncbi:elongation factor P maturation arginine rhamnosyltransferase EarP [Pseudomonadota bacterium AL_CKDN230030165-1A_HGKHYDSX7]